MNNNTKTGLVNVEELCRFIEDINKILKTKINQSRTCRNKPKIPPLQEVYNIVIGSMDVEALYPSITRRMAIAAITKAIIESKPKWESIDYKLLSKYIGITHEWDIITAHKLENVIQKPKTKTSLNSFSNPSARTKECNHENQFHPPIREPNESEKKLMLAIAIAHTVSECMRNHFYKIGSETKGQTDGGAIGSRLTGEAANVTMIQWDRDFLKKLKK